MTFLRRREQQTPEITAGKAQLTLKLPPGAALSEIGDGGYQAGGAVFFVKGSSYVQVLPSDEEAADWETSQKNRCRH